MLSVAKHLLFLIENKQKQILRFAQNDTAQEFFRSLFQPLKLRGLKASFESQSRVAQSFVFKTLRVAVCSIGQAAEF